MSKKRLPTLTSEANSMDPAARRCGAMQQGRDKVPPLAPAPVDFLRNQTTSKGVVAMSKMFAVPPAKDSVFGCGLVLGESIEQVRALSPISRHCLRITPHTWLNNALRDGLGLEGGGVPVVDVRELYAIIDGKLIWGDMAADTIEIPVLETTPPH